MTFAIITISHTRSLENDTIYAAIAAVADSSPDNPAGSSGIRSAGVFLGDQDNGGQVLTVPVNLKIPFSFVTNIQLMLSVGVANLGRTAGAAITDFVPPLEDQLATALAGTLGGGHPWFPLGEARPPTPFDLAGLLGLAQSPPPSQLSDALNMGFCNGGLIADSRLFPVDQIAAPNVGDIWSIPGTGSYPGYDSPDGCGSNSQYGAIITITRTG